MSRSSLPAYQCSVTMPRRNVMRLRGNATAYRCHAPMLRVIFRRTGATSRCTGATLQMLRSNLPTYRCYVMMLRSSPTMDRYITPMSRDNSGVHAFANGVNAPDSWQPRPRTRGSFQPLGGTTPSKGSVLLLRCELCPDAANDWGGPWL
jgi:hypothetical protein